MSLSVKLEAFDGPLDLLLHLIEKNTDPEGICHDLIGHRQITDHAIAFP